jgi:O-acetyl-ADP-ribose deacetylase (regulator of RNase III)
MIHDQTGNLLKAPVEALVNTVNTEGVMGKGIALQFKRAYPAMFKAYAAACKAGQVRLGEMWVWQTGALDGPRLIINFPTKGHWRNGSKFADIQTGLDELVRVIRENAVESIAVPPLGCGNGGLDWAEVKPEIERALSPLVDLDVWLYSPVGAPLAAEMQSNTARPRMTRGKAALVTLLHQYSRRSLEVSLIETQKLMYFLQEAGEPLRLDYEKGLYGPFANNLGHVLKNIEGHFVSGFGDGSRAVQANEALVVLPGAAEAAAVVVGELPDLEDRIESVLKLVDGFESAYDMELLATIHWVATRDDVSAASDPEVAGRLVRSWNQRKHGLFGQTHVNTAWSQLKAQGWLTTTAHEIVALSQPID